MFTGIIEKTPQISAVADIAMSRRLTIAHDWPDLKPGESIAINGVCLTIADLSTGQVSFDVIQETLAKTNLGSLASGDLVNAERAMRIGDRIDGHFVQGHVDGTAKLVNKSFTQNENRLTIEAPPHLAKYLAPKGSICIDGVSLTIASLDRNRFDVALIPTTLKLTTLGSRDLGWHFNLEADIISKQVIQFLEMHSIGDQKSK